LGGVSSRQDCSGQSMGAKWDRLGAGLNPRLPHPPHRSRERGLQTGGGPKSGSTAAP
jgi:hypothetical protein